MKGYRTLWAAAILAVLGVILPALGSADVPAWVLTAAAALQAGLRVITTGPVPKLKKEPTE